MLNFISLEVNFEIYEATFSVNLIDSTVHNEVYIVSSSDYDIDKLMKQCEGISTFMITADGGSSHVYSGYGLEEIYMNPENEEEIILIFTKDNIS